MLGTGPFPGSLAWRKDVRLGLVDHYGVVVQSWPLVIAHIDKSITGHLHVKVEPFETFAEGREVTFEPVAEPVPLDVMWTRVEAVARSKRPFGLLCWGEDWNCESFARFVKDGLPQSEQAVGANVLLGTAALVGVVALVASGGTDSSYDANVGRYRDRKGRFTSG